MAGQVIVCSNSKEWEQYEKKPMVLAFFTAPWSGQAHKIAPIVRDLAREYPHVFVVQLDMRQFETIAKGKNVNSAPALVFMKGGEFIEKLVTTRPDPLYEKMDKLFS